MNTVGVLKCQLLQLLPEVFELSCHIVITCSLKLIPVSSGLQFNKVKEDQKVVTKIQPWYPCMSLQDKGEQKYHETLFAVLKALEIIDLMSSDITLSRKLSTNSCKKHLQGSIPDCWYCNVRSLTVSVLIFRSYKTYAVQGIQCAIIPNQVAD